jgi:hypothetical protein
MLAGNNSSSNQKLIYGYTAIYFPLGRVVKEEVCLHVVQYIPFVVYACSQDVFCQIIWGC